MKNTQINSNTLINSEIVHNEKHGSETIINDTVISTQNEPSTFIDGKYTVIQKLNSSGEADIYLCEYNGEKCVAKVYRRSGAIKESVIERLQNINSPYIVHSLYTGIEQGHFLEILPYFKNGSISGKKYSLSELMSSIIPQVNEALKTLHDVGVIHKDLKPSNIMLHDDGKTVCIIDFGISSVQEEGRTVLVTKTGLTPEYSAPETFRNLFLEQSDYYSFGITLFELYTGTNPYHNLSMEETERYTAIQRFPFPKDFPQELKDLISGLTYPDITNRGDKNNPNRRWTYDEVKNWLAGKRQSIPGSTVNDASKSFKITIGEKDYHDTADIAHALSINWDEGKKLLFRGKLSSFFKLTDPNAAEQCLQIEEESAHSSGKDDLLFMKLIYHLDNNLKAFCWNGKVFESIPVLGRDILDSLWSGDRGEYYIGILSSKALSCYAECMKLEKKQKQILSDYEQLYETEKNSNRDVTRLLYTIGYKFSGQILLKYKKYCIKNTDELTELMKSLLDKSYDHLSDFCHEMIQQDGSLDPQLEAWLIAIGKKKELESWHKSMFGV